MVDYFLSKNSKIYEGACGHPDPPGHRGVLGEPGCKCPGGCGCGIEDVDQSTDDEEKKEDDSKPLLH